MAQAVETDQTKRLQMIDRMQQMLNDAAVQPALVYPKALQVYNTARWTGWTPVKLNGAPGPVFFSSYNTETYLNLKPRTESATSSSTPLVTGVVVGVVVIAAVVVWLVVRRRSRPTDEVVDS